MTDLPDIVTRLTTAYDNMGTATRDDLKEAADVIKTLRDQCTVGNIVVAAVVRELSELTGRTADEIVAQYRWSIE